MASPHETEPNIRTSEAPYRSAIARISSRLLRMSSRVNIPLFYHPFFDHCDHVGEGDVGLDCDAGFEDVAAALAHLVFEAADLFADLGWGSPLGGGATLRRPPQNARCCRTRY